MVSLRASRAQRASAEAAAWIARLQSPDCCPETEAALADWLKLDAAHRRAFDHATEVWGMIPAAALRQPVTAARPAPARRRRGRAPLAPAVRRWSPALAVCLVLLLAVGVLLLGGSGGFSTAVGEQQMATLDDGTRITLNTDTQLHVRYADDLRSVALDRGEAMFEVAPNPRRPFVVTAGDTKIRALGTSFIVRRARGSVVVTLIQGKVSVTDGTLRPDSVPGTAPSTILAPGERLTVTGQAGSLIDRPSIEAVTAWRRGQAVFSDTPLSDAIAELNRYGGPHVVLDDPRLASLRVSGVFATNDTVEFATAIAALHGLQVSRSRAEVVIAR